MVYQLSLAIWDKIPKFEIWQVRIQVSGSRRQLRFLRILILDSGHPQNPQADLSILRVYQLSLAILGKKLEIEDLAFHDLGAC